MGREDELGAFGNQHLLGNVAGLGLDVADLVHQDDGVNHHAVADDIDGTFAENTGGNGVQHESLSVKTEGMSRVGATLEARDHFVIRGQHIDHLAFAFVSPLETENDVYFAHSYLNF